MITKREKIELKYLVAVDFSASVICASNDLITPTAASSHKSTPKSFKFCTQALRKLLVRPIWARPPQHFSFHTSFGTCSLSVLAKFLVFLFQWTHWLRSKKVDWENTQKTLCRLLSKRVDFRLTIRTPWTLFLSLSFHPFTSLALYCFIWSNMVLLLNIQTWVPYYSYSCH